MTWLVDNWCVVVGLIALVIAACIYLFQTDEKRVLEWLLGAVTNAEKELGGGTGRLKLRAVYDAFIVKFPVFSKIISFDRFAGLVDKALEQMREILKNNIAVQKLVGVNIDGADSAENKEE